MKNIEKYPNTKDALEAYNSPASKPIPFNEWLESEYEEPHPLVTPGESDYTLLDAADDVINEWYVMTPHGSRTRFVAALSRLSSAIDREKRKPVRNCDKYKTADEAYQALKEFCGKYKCRDCRFGDRVNVTDCTIVWLYEEAEKEETK